MPIRACSLHQPWASLVVIGAKPWEFRSWPMRVAGQDWAVHAAARKPSPSEIARIAAAIIRGRTDGMDPALALPLLQRALSDPSVLPLGAVLGTVTAGEPVEAWRLFPGADPNCWANPVANPVAFEQPIPARGKQGWWWWERP